MFSTECCKCLVDSILNDTELILEQHLKYKRKVIQKKIIVEGIENANKFKSLTNLENEKAMEILSLVNNSWLSANPMTDNNARLNKHKLKNTLHTRCNLKIPNLPSKCNDCRSAFAMEHTMIYKKGGLMRARNNYVRDELASIISVTTHSKKIKIEPVLLPSQK